MNHRIFFATLAAFTASCEGAPPVEDAPPHDSATPVEPPPTDTPEPPLPEETDPPPDSPAPCDLGEHPLGEDAELSLTWEGRTRTYRLHVPADYDCSPRPLVIGLHFFTGDAAGFELSTAQIHDHLNANGTFGLFPQALEASPGDGITAFNDTTSHASDGPDGATCAPWAWGYPVFDDCPPEAADESCQWGTSCADDVGMVRELVRQLQATYTIDADRIWLTGFSQGGIATQGWACALSDVVAAIAPLHGAAANGYTCGPTEAVSMMDVWGTTDVAINRWGAPSLDGLIYDAADETAAVWAEAQGCDVRATPYATVSDGVWGWDCTAHADCATGADVVTCSWNGTHIWGRDPWNGDFMWEAVWAFFQDHPKVR